MAMHVHVCFRSKYIMQFLYFGDEQYIVMTFDDPVISEIYLTFFFMKN